MPERAETAGRTLPARERVDLALRAGRLGTFVWDLAARTVDWDDALRSLYGLGAEAAPTVAFADDSTHPDDRDALRALADEIVDGRRDHLDHAYRITLPDGRTRWMHAWGRVRDGLLVGVVQDVTELREAELARESALAAQRSATATAAASRRRLELLAHVAALLDTPPDIEATLQQVADLAVNELSDWCAVDLGPADGRPRIVATAHRDAQMVALARDVQRRWPPPPDDPARAALLETLQPLHLPEIDDELLKAGAQDEEHLELLRSLGMTSAVSVPLQSGGRGFGVMLLVTTGGRRLGEEDVDLALELGRRAGAAVEKAQLLDAQARNARALALSEARYRTLVEAGSLGVFRTDPAGTALSDARAWGAVLGGGVPVETGWLDAVHPDDAAATRAAWTAALGSGTPFDHRYRVRTADGRARWSRARAVPLRAVPDDPASPVLEWVGTVDDVTDVVLAQRHSEAVRDSAEALARALGVDEVVHSLHHVAAAALDAHASAVGIVQADGLVVDQFGYTGLPRVTSPGPQARATWPVLHEVVANGGPVYARTVDELRAAVAATLGGAGSAAGVAVAEGEVAWAVLPLRYGGETVGVVRFGWTEPHVFDRAERDTLQAVAAQHAAALARARLYDTERRTSLTLQAALAPQVPSCVHGVEVAMHYRPAGSGAQVGGDWVDALPLPGGRVCLVVGDVMGSGIPAAATMGRLRTALTALAVLEHDPARLLCHLDEMLVPGELLATVALAVVDPAGRLDVYSAGHLPVLVAHPDGECLLVEGQRVPPVGVGWSQGSAWPERTSVPLRAGSVVALCTDGLVETRHDPIDARLAAWRAEVAGRLPPGALHAAAAEVVAAMHASPDDDVTLLLARVPGPAAG